MMRKSTLFLSLSGLSGVLAGVYALIGAAVVYKLLQHHYLYYPYVIIESKTFKAIIAVALLVLVASVLTAYLFSMRKAKRNGEKLITPTAKRAFYNFALPLLTGGALCILLINNGHYGLLAPMTLIFYGLACVNVSKYTFGDVRVTDRGRHVGSVHGEGGVLGIQTHVQRHRSDGIGDGGSVVQVNPLVLAPPGRGPVHGTGVEVGQSERGGHAPRDGGLA